MPFTTKSSVIATVTGKVSAITATGKLDASMLEIATTSSMMNSMNMPDCSSTPSGWIRMKVHAMPKNRSSMMKRRRQERRLAVPGGSLRNCRQVRMITRWMIKAPAVQVPEVSTWVHRLDKEPDGDDEKDDHQRSGQPVLGELAQQFVVEHRPRAAGRRQPIARFAYVLSGKTPLRRRGGAKRCSLARFAGPTWHYCLRLALICVKSRRNSLRRGLSLLPAYGNSTYCLALWPFRRTSGRSFWGTAAGAGQPR